MGQDGQRQETVDCEDEMVGTYKAPLIPVIGTCTGDSRANRKNVVPSPRGRIYSQHSDEESDRGARSFKDGRAYR